jgi:hypothetical protein
MGNGNGISRRDFLKFLGAGTAILTLGGFGGLTDLFNPNQKTRFPYAHRPLQPQLASAQQGSWAFGDNTSISPIHVALLPSGKILYLAGSGWNYNNQSGPFQAIVRDATSGSEVTLQQQEDLFCSGMTSLADGTVLFAGGTLQYDQSPDNCNGRWHGESCTYEFSPTTETFTKRADMAHGRWYPTLITLPDGKVFTFTGYDEYGIMNMIVEVYDPSTKSWTIRPEPGGTATYTVGSGVTSSCPGAVTPTYTGVGPESSFYPRGHLMPSGLVILCGFRPEVRSWRPSDGDWVTTTVLSTNRHYGASFLLPLHNLSSEKGKILVVGGSPTSDDYAVTSCQIIDYDASSTAVPVIRTVSSTTYRRKFMSPVTLPNGKFVVFGGTEIGTNETAPVRTPEMFDPVTESWQVLPASSVARVYHSTALLLPDGRVWVAGGMRQSNIYEARTEFFSPDYLFAGARPTISADPTVGGYGSTISISTPDEPDVTSVSLLRLMNTTHHYDANQRLIWLQIVGRGSGSITVSAPISANIAPPGYYMIHILNSAGVPSTARIIKIPGAGGGGGPTPPSQVIGLNVTRASTTQLDLSWTANPSGDNVTSYNVYRGTAPGFPVTPGTTTPIATPTTNSYSDTGLTASTRYYYKVAAVNSSGIGPLSQEATEPEPDTTRPGLAITSPASGSTLPPGTVTVSGTASDNIGVRDVRVRVDSNAYQTATTTNAWANWTINLSITALGSHSITANARDAAGNFLTQLINITISDTPPTPDTTPPSLAITSPVANATVSSPITVTGTASDNLGVRDVRVRIDSGTYQLATTANAWANWSISIASPTGSHTITVNARDQAGNFRTAARAVNVT